MVQHRWYSKYWIFEISRLFSSKKLQKYDNLTLREIRRKAHSFNSLRGKKNFFLQLLNNPKNNAYWHITLSCSIMSRHFIFSIIYWNIVITSSVYQKPGFIKKNSEFNESYNKILYNLKINNYIMNSPIQPTWNMLIRKHPQSGFVMPIPYGYYSFNIFYKS